MITGPLVLMWGFSIIIFVMLAMLWYLRRWDEKYGDIDDWDDWWKDQ